MRIGSREFPYDLLRHPRARRMRISIRPGRDGTGRILLTVPKRGSIRAGEAFLCRHAEWALREAERFSSRLTAVPHAEADNYRRRRAEAGVYIREKVKHWSGVYGLRHAGVTVRDQTSRWGSCSSKGRLSFSWRLLLLPERYADYVVVHELCHLVEFNHSSRFWTLVAREIPEYRDIARALRRG
ncbi:MAG: M48 family metallopeptidase [Candidatus Moranbacteria bacterium]|nr:M48 family metallopeptidase [Candidatus Moranbacteria bacterium]